MFARKLSTTRVPTMTPPDDWRPGLMALAKRGPGFVALDKLLADVAGDYIGGRMLWWLFVWWPHSTQADGSVYKSAADWEAETGISAGMANNRNRIEKLEAAGVTFYKKRVKGAPVRHYRLDVRRFVQRLAETLDVPVSFVKLKLFDVAWVTENRTNGFVDLTKSDLVESAKSLTQESLQSSPNGEQKKQQPPPQDGGGVDKSPYRPPGKILDFTPPPDSEAPTNPVTRVLKDAGLRPATARAFDWLNRRDVEDLIDQAAAKAEAGEIRVTRAAYIAGALKKMAAQEQDAYGREVAHGLFEGSFEDWKATYRAVNATPPREDLAWPDPWEEPAIEIPF